MPTLLEIGGDLAALLELIEEHGDELSPEDEAALDQWFASIGADRDEKLDNYGGLIRELTLRAAARREEKERLARRVQAAENVIANLKDRLKLFLELAGLKKVETRRYTIAVQTNGGVQPFELTIPPAMLPDKFQAKEITARTEDIRAALVAGEYVPGAKLLPRGSHLRIS